MHNKSASASATRGRPRLPADQKKTKLSVTLSNSTLQLIDDLRGETPRSEFIDKAVGRADLIQLDEIRAVKKNEGIFYTPRSLSRFVAKKALDCYTQANTNRNTSKLLVFLGCQIKA